MKTVIGLIGLTLVALVAAPVDIAAQDLAIVNARILDGKGGVIERGSVVVRGGKIASVGSGAAPSGVQRIDAQGRTVMPGFIDAHRHIATGRPGRMARQARAGADAGVPRRRLHHRAVCDLPRPGDRVAAARSTSGTVKGPRLLDRTDHSAGAPGPARLVAAIRRASTPRVRRCARRKPAGAIPPAETIKAVESIASRKYDYLKTIITTTPGGPEVDTLKLIVAEGKKRNLPTITHAVSVIDTLAAVDARPDVLVHTPHIGHLEDDAAAVKKIAGAGIPMTSTLQVFVPHFGSGQHAALPRRRAVPVEHALERRAGTGQRAAAVGSRHLVRLRHGHHLAAEGVAGRRAARAQPGVLAARHQQDHGAGRRAIDAAPGYRHARAGEGRRSGAHRRQPACQHQRSAESDGDDQGRPDCVGSRARNGRATK